MRKLLLLLLSLMMFMISASATEFYHFHEDAYPGLYDRDLRISFDRVRMGSGAGVLLILDENGNMLGQRKVDGQAAYDSIKISITEDMPLGQTIRLVLEKNGERIDQDECLLAADAAKRDGLRLVKTDEKKIAITFDTACSLGKIPELLDTLDALNIKCTFFIQGDIMTNYREWVEEIHNRGHELANHSMHHPDMREMSNTAIYKEITKCNALIEEVTGQPVTLYRPPSGYYTYRDRAIGRALGSEMILWTFDSLDGFKDSSRDKVIKTMYRKSEPGAIILMHSYGTHTISVLNEYVPAMQAQGYDFVTVTELMPVGGVLDSQGVMQAP
ncbi:MAG: polysaccharide deacetylase family protein [Clostridiales bacterium]|nr:polysaccharide deacetylase family protein [Clostridiales bacterium]